MKLTPKQIDNVFQALIGMPPRSADKAVLEMMGDSVEIVAEYIWDYMLGEPDELTYQQVLKAVKKHAKG